MLNIIEQKLLQLLGEAAELEIKIETLEEENKSLKFQLESINKTLTDIRECNSAQTEYWRNRFKEIETHDGRVLKNTDDLKQAYADLLKLKPREKQSILLVEDGSVNLDELEGEIPARILVYRQGATPPFKIEI